MAACSSDGLSEASHALSAKPTFASACIASKKVVDQKEYARFANKVDVKSFVKAHVPVVPTLTVVRNESQITQALIATLPDEYVVKGVHGAGMVVLVKGETARSVRCTKSKYRFGCVSYHRREHAAFLKETCRMWLQRDYGSWFQEVHYSHTWRGCVFERSIMDAHGVAPRDVKVFVAHGEPAFVMDVANRYSVGAAPGGDVSGGGGGGRLISSNSSATRHVLLDPTGRLLPGSYQGVAAAREYREACAGRQRGGPQAASPPASAAALMPEYGEGQYALLLSKARVIAAEVARATGQQHLPQLRVDFFANATHHFFGELTFFTAACKGVGIVRNGTVTHAYTWYPPRLDHLLAHIVATPRTAISASCLAEIMIRSCAAPVAVRARAGVAGKAAAPARHVAANASTAGVTVRPQPRLREEGATDRALVWTIHRASHGAPPKALHALRTSVESSLPHAVLLKLSMVVLHTGHRYGGQALTCASLLGGTSTSSPVLAAMPAVAAIASSLPCEHVTLTPTSARGCRLAPGRLAAGKVYIAEMATEEGEEEGGLAELTRFIASHGGANRPDLVRGGVALANNFRFVLDKLLLPYGVRQALYLDSDTCIHPRTNLATLFGASRTAAFVAAHRRSGVFSHCKANCGKWAYGRSWPQVAFDGIDLGLTERRWGFRSPTQQGFNAGILMINTEAFCRIDLFGVMLEVARFHAHVQPLWRLSGNQAVAEVAGARHIAWVNGSWNCAKDDANSRDCHIVHGSAQGIQRWCLNDAAHALADDTVVTDATVATMPAGEMDATAPVPMESRTAGWWSALG